AGGVTVSYFEQVQNTYNFDWDLDDVHRRLDTKMTQAFHDVYDQYAGRKDIHMRQAAYMIAIARVAEACRLRGWI
ncbi:MAG: glutamate dehydrogenase, partial [Fidelibacterota bacterium]